MNRGWWYLGGVPMLGTGQALDRAAVPDRSALFGGGLGRRAFGEAWRARAVWRDLATVRHPVSRASGQWHGPDSGGIAAGQTGPGMT